MSLIAEFKIPSSRFLLGETLPRIPGVTVELEQIIPTHGQVLPFLWATNHHNEAFLDAANGDPTVETIQQVAEVEGGLLCAVEWATPETDDSLGPDIAGSNGVLLEAEGQDDRWHLKMRFDDREDLSSLQSYCVERDISFDVIRLYDLTRPKMGQYNISEKQVEVLLLALDGGYFNIPRDCAMADLADELDLSTRAVSERLRRGLTNLLNNTVTIGQPTGIGVGEND